MKKVKLVAMVTIIINTCVNVCAPGEREQARGAEREREKRGRDEYVQFDVATNHKIRGLTTAIK